MHSSEYFESCLQRRKLPCWNREGVARARFRYHQVLKSLGKDEEASAEVKAAYTTRDQLKKECEGYLHDPDPDNELAIFDQMCSMWAGRFTGKIAQSPAA